MILSKDILSRYNSEFENNQIIIDVDTHRCYFKLANNTQKILRI